MKDLKKRLQELLRLYESAEKSKTKPHMKIALVMSNEVLREIIAEL